MNTYDSRLAASILSSHGWQETLDTFTADLIIVNTCSVRKHAEDRATGRISVLSKSRKKGALLCVMGCMAQRLGEKLKHYGADFVLGTDALTEFANIAESQGLISSGCFTDQTDFTGEGIYTEQNQLSTFIAITRGCDNYCAYCIVPYVRGHLRSRNPSDIFEEAVSHVSSGAKEITLLGQNVNSYNFGETSFTDLIERISQIDGLKRIRFTTNHPKDWTSDIARSIAENPKVAPSVHLPVQSGSDRVLELMGRGYTRKRYQEIIQELKSLVPDISISSDILVGFPNETHEDYLETLSVIEESGYSGLFSFKYSVRPGTRSAEMTDDVPEQVKLERLKDVIVLGQKIANEYSKKLLGSCQSVLIEEVRADNPLPYRGRTATGRIAEFYSESGLTLSVGDLADVLIEEHSTWILKGKHSS